MACSIPTIRSAATWMHYALALIKIRVDELLDSQKGIISAALICEEVAETAPRCSFGNGLTIHIACLNGALGCQSGNVAPWGAKHHDRFCQPFGHGFCALIVGDDLP